MLKDNSHPRLSLIIPTRERAAYLGDSIRTCIANRASDLEILVIDNASEDNTFEVVRELDDKRIRYVRNRTRLSMRDNFERGLELAEGDILCFLGDDDAVFPFTVDRVLELFETYSVDAVSAARAHYFWPDMLSNRRNTALIPRGHGVVVTESRASLRHLLDHNDYYRLPCLYHGFVRRSVVERIKERQGRFFLSSQVDIFSAIALSMENLRFAFSRSPLVINGGSRRSNGASHFGGGSEKEKQLWKLEDELGFLSGFEDCLTVGALIVESALRYCDANPKELLSGLFGPDDVARGLWHEHRARMRAGRFTAESAKMFESSGLTFSSSPRKAARLNASRVTRIVRSFLNNCPVDMQLLRIFDLHRAAIYLDGVTSRRSTGFLNNPFNQISAAVRIMRN